MAELVILKQDYDCGYLISKEKAVTHGPIELLISVAESYMEKLGYDFRSTRQNYALTYTGRNTERDLSHSVQITLSDPNYFTEEYFNFHEKGIIPDEYKE